jgi:hypothetical protein
VAAAVQLDGYHLHLTAGVMDRGRHWAGVLSRRALRPLSGPHPASAAAEGGGVTYCSTVLPWRSCGPRAPWIGQRHADRAARALCTVLEGLPRSKLVWGGDWNLALEGPEYAGSLCGGDHLLVALAALGLQAPTAPLPHRLGGCTIDHVAVPRRWKALGKSRTMTPTSCRLKPECAGRRLSCVRSGCFFPLQ